ncbi:hypothetical protein ACR76H_16725 [Bacteroides kribbi]
MQASTAGKGRKGKQTAGDFTEYPTHRDTRRGTERTSSIWEGCRANPRAVSMEVLDAGRPLYLCMGKSNRRGSVGNEIRENVGYDSDVKREAPMI